MKSSLAIESELNKERASALGRTGRRLEELLARCAELAKELSTLHGDARRPVVAEYRQTRARASETRWEMCVQREAMGLRRHDDVDSWFPEPPIIKE